MTALAAVFAGVLGALIGSFGNVVIYRLPRGESIAFPGSHCPHCNRALGPLELVPVLSFIVLRGRCRTCGQRIGLRYPIVESAMAALFVALVLRWPPAVHGTSVLPVAIVLAMLLMAAVIDLDLHVLPDALTLPALGLALIGTVFYLPGSGLPSFPEAFVGAGAAGGWQVGLLVGLASLALNLVTRRTLRLPEGLTYALWLVALGVSATGLGVPLAAALAGSVLAAGTWAVLGSIYWWGHDLVRPTTEEAPSAEDDEPVAMGFGDVKLAAAIGAVLGWQQLLVGLFLAVTLGAIVGIGVRAAGGERIIPFGPALLLGGILSLFFGHGIISWYLGLLGVG